MPTASRSSGRNARRVLFALSALALSLAVAGCESLDSLNPFTEKEKKLTGNRVPVFPNGVPGVDYNAPPPQPASPGGYVAPAAPEATGSTPATPAPAAKQTQ